MEAPSTTSTSSPPSQTPASVSNTASAHRFSFFVASLPYSIRILLESAVRNCDDFSVKEQDIETILNWKQSSQNDAEIPFRPARVILQDFTYVKIITIELSAKFTWFAENAPLILNQGPNYPFLCVQWRARRCRSCRYA